MVVIAKRFRRKWNINTRVRDKELALAAKVKGAQDKENQLTGDTPTGTANPNPQGGATNTPSPAIPDAGNQDVYASHYDKSTARPTVVNINIAELAHFDRTSVASSAQERDLMAAMEEKIAESIYRLSMTALNNVSGYMA